MALQKVMLNRAGLKAILTGDEVRKDLLRRMEKVKGAATKTPDLEIEDDTSNEKGSWGRARVTLKSTADGAFFREAATGDLSKALDEAK